MSNQFSVSRRLLLAMLLLLPLPGLAESGLLVVEKPRIMQPPPGAQVAAGFMLLVNPGDSDVVLTGASSAAFGHVEIHESVVENDVAKMIKQSELIVPAGSSVELKHGSYHLMLMDIKSPLEADQEIPLMLETDSGALHVVLKVVGPGHMSKGQGAESHSHGMSGDDKMMDKTMDGKSMKMDGDKKEMSGHEGHDMAKPEDSN